MIRSHDETSKKALYVNSIHTLGFEGMSREESLLILDFFISR
ncbi:MAG: TauD/TfdA family dioxygenase [Gammaproteobacteria bacterium]|nr:TauD/TfdA family dioxygenase [Gammaproteobacteria bacterium]